MSRSSRSAARRPAPARAARAGAFFLKTPLCWGACLLSSVPLAGWAQQEGAGALDEVQVNADRAGEAATPARRAQASSRLGLSVLETPRAVSVVERELLDQQGATTERDVLRNASGVASRSEYYGSYSQFSVRGLWANNTYNYLRDGAKFMHLIDPPLFNVERVEVIKGPAALEFGQVAPGGLIHYVSKQPQAEALRSVRLGAGSHGWRSGEFDLTGPLDAGGTLLYRLTGGASRGGSAVDGITPEKRGLAGSLEWRISPQTRWRVQAETFRLDTTSNPGLAVPVPTDLGSADAVPDSRFYGEPWLTSKGQLRFYSSELTHRFNDTLDARLYVSRNETDRDILLTTLTGVAAGRVGRGYWLAPGQSFTSDTVLAELRGRWQVGAVEHRVLAGIDWRTMESRYGASGTGSLPSVDLWRPAAGVATPVGAAGAAAVASDTRNPGFYLQDRMAWGPWALTAGLRHDRLKDTYARPVLDASKTQPSFALSYEATPGTMLYASHARSFQANVGTLLVGNVAAPPSEGKQIEVGVKQEWLDRRLLTTVALFDLELTNSPANDAANPGYSVLTGRQRIRGLELEARGRIAPGWTVTAQATFMDPKVLADTVAGANVGNRVALATKRTASLWTQYRIAAVPGLWVGGGFTHQGDKFLANNNRWRLPGYTVADLAVGYEMAGGMRLQANLKNAADKRYYLDGTSNAAGFTSATPGEARALQVTLDYAF
ncbi:TonB-dependent siderophore receptor [Paracidovorax konjaci]|uniref:Iron complex outermembrane recepter protein n=1 Tax=Paracidovorax konjaci TaxID=32040 RepID=A0A1I1S5K6_9BURK|nr:TonB-dependent siderophore receptor [Paracidovorax konjaci]SFD39083.1 iron complex outermembrane recepter protein [Paracidovorax konjaci]